MYHINNKLVFYMTHPFKQENMCQFRNFQNDNFFPKVIRHVEFLVISKSLWNAFSLLLFCQYNCTGLQNLFVWNEQQLLNWLGQFESTLQQSIRQGNNKEVRQNTRLPKFKMLFLLKTLLHDFGFKKIGRLYKAIIWSIAFAI